MTPDEENPNAYVEYQVTQDGCIKNIPIGCTKIIIPAPRKAKICEDSNIPSGCLIVVETGAELEIDATTTVQGYYSYTY